MGPGNYIAGTDGFVMGTIYPPTTTTIYQNFSIFGMSNGVVAWATGGGTLQCNAGSTNYYPAPTGGMFILPVSAGDSFTVAVPPITRLVPPVPYFAFYWIPLGAAPITATQTTKKKSRKSKKLKTRSSAAKKILATSKKPASKKKPVNKKSGKRSTTR